MASNAVFQMRAEFPDHAFEVDDGVALQDLRETMGEAADETLIGALSQFQGKVKVVFICAAKIEHNVIGPFGRIPV